MNTTPRSFQDKTVGIIESASGRMLVAHEMGLGKTFTSYLFAHRNPSAFPMVVVCPATLKWNWEREAAVHFNWRAEVLGGTKPGRVSIPSYARILIVNYDVLHAWVPRLLELKPGLVVFDEGHYLASRTSRRTKAAIKLADQVERVLLLSGTPMMNRPADLWAPLRIVDPKLFPSFFTFAHRYCLPADAPILMGDLREKPVSEIVIGEEVIGWSRPENQRRRLVRSKVLDVLVQMSPLQKVTLQDGTELICTPDHRWHTGSSNKFEYMEARIGRLGGAGRGMASRIAKVFRGTLPKYDDVDYRLGYIHGFFRGDGHCSVRQERRYYPFKNGERWMKKSYPAGCACKDKGPIIQISRILTEFGIRHRRFRRGDGLYAIGKISRKEFYDFITKTSAARDVDSWWAGFLGGIYDAEGSGCTIAQKAGVNSPTHKMIQNGLQRFGFDLRVREDAIHFRGGRRAILRFWNIANPTLRRKLYKPILSAGGRFGGGVCDSASSRAATSAPMVVRIEPLPGIHVVYTLTTETGNYVAYGCGSKNCAPKRTFYGWDFSGASHLDELHEKIKPRVTRLRKSDVLTELPEQQDAIVLVDLTDREEYEKLRDEYLEFVGGRKPSALDKEDRDKVRGSLFRLKHLVAQLKLPGVFDWLEQFFANTDEKLICFGIHRESVVEKIHERFARKSSIITGQVTGRGRQQAFDRFLRDKKCKLLAGNIDAAGVGLSARGVSNTAFVELPWTPAKIDQAKARTHGIGRGEAGKVCQSWFLIARNTVESKLLKIIQRKRSYADQVLDGGKVSDPFELYDELTEMLRREREVVDVE